MIPKLASSLAAFGICGLWQMPIRHSANKATRDSGEIPEKNTQQTYPICSMYSPFGSRSLFASYGSSFFGLVRGSCYYQAKILADCPWRPIAHHVPATTQLLLRSLSVQAKVLGLWEIRFWAGAHGTRQFSPQPNGAFASV